MKAQLSLYLQELQRQLDKLCDAIHGLDEAQLNWKPPVEGSNSIFVIATHTLGNVRGWVLGICCGQPIERDRAAEFAVSGPDARPLIEHATTLSREIEAAFATLDAGSLDDLREARQNLWGAGTTRPVSGREAILHALEHAANHIGHIEITRDLVRAGALR